MDFFFLLKVLENLDGIFSFSIVISRVKDVSDLIMYLYLLALGLDICVCCESVL